MQFEKLTIGLRQPYGKPGPNNPYEAKLEVGYNDNRMHVKLSDETCRRILAMAGDEIASAAQIQISDFVHAALTVATTPMIEGKAEREEIQEPF
jgi:hypothetical protein